MQRQPFIRLAEMKPRDHAVPRVLVWLDGKQLRNFSDNTDFNDHPEVGMQILNSAELSLRFDLTRTRNPDEQARLKKLLSLVKQEKRGFNSEKL